MEQEIELGDKVKCIYTGFTGFVIAKTEFVNGCIQFSVVPKWDKSKNPIEQEMSIDSESLELVSKKEKPKQKETGGPMRTAFKQKGY